MHNSQLLAAGFTVSWPERNVRLLVTVDTHSHTHIKQTKLDCENDYSVWKTTDFKTLFPKKWEHMEVFSSHASANAAAAAAA